MTADDGKRAPGRPNDPKKREALLKAARDLLLEQGVDVPMDMIAAKAGVSKATLYARFPDRKAVVEAVLRQESDRLVLEEQAAECLSKNLAADLEAALVAYGLRYLTFISEQQTSGWARLISAIALSEPEAVRRFFDLGTRLRQSRLTAIIQTGIDTGQAETTSAAEAASDLIGLWLGFTGVELNLHARAPLAPDEIRQRIERGVALFMGLHGPGAAPASRSKS